MAFPTLDTVETVCSLVASGIPRLLLEADLEPVQGERFQPTGFPDLGAATYTLPNGTEMLLVESPQSVANRLESACWDEAKNDLVPALAGLPYVRVTQKGEYLTSSIQEFHRINSPYILESSDKSFLVRLQELFPSSAIGATNNKRLAEFVFRHDPNTLLHGVFLARSDIAGGRLRLLRLLSGFVEARDVRPAESGGVKFDRVDPSGDTSRGFGHVPFHRTEYTAGQIRAYFNLDLATLRGYGLPKEAMVLLVGLGLWKVERFLAEGLRLRSACDLDCTAIRVTRPQGVVLPTPDQLEASLPELIEDCGPLFAEPRRTEVRWFGETKPKKAAAAGATAAAPPDDGGDEE